MIIHSEEYQMISITIIKPICVPLLCITDDIIPNICSTENTIYIGQCSGKDQLNGNRKTHHYFFA